MEQTAASQPRYPRARIDALTDGIFAVAMTLLVLDIHLPEGLHPANSQQLLDGVWDLGHKLFIYALSFLFLGRRWLSIAQIPSEAEHLGPLYVRWWILYLMLVTLVPFTTMLVGTHPLFASALWFYCANIALLALASWRMVEATPRTEHHTHSKRRRINVAFALLSLAACVVWSVFNPSHAVYALLINLLAPVFTPKET